MQSHQIKNEIDELRRKLACIQTLRSYLANTNLAPVRERLADDEKLWLEELFQGGTDDQFVRGKIAGLRHVFQTIACLLDEEESTTIMLRELAEELDNSIK